MSLKSQESQRILLLMLLLVLITSSQFGISFFEMRSQQQRDLDTRLLQATGIVNAFIDGPVYHKGLGPDSMSVSAERAMAEKLTDLARTLDLAYIYTMKQVDDEIKFISSSLTPEELAGAKYDPVFWQTYEQAPEAVAKAIDLQRPVYENYEDKWGVFRSIFVAYLAQDGNPYIVGVDLPIEDVKYITRKSATDAFKRTIVFFVLLAPFLFYGICMTRASFRRRRDALLRDELTGLQNKNALLEDIPRFENPTLMIINIDRFREVSHGYSYEVGDAVLSSFAYNLHSYQHPELKAKNVYRLYSDEFAVLVESPLNEHTNIAIFQDFYNCIVTRKYRVSETDSISFRVTVGITTGKSDNLFQQAEIALRLARESNTSVVPYHKATDVSKRYLENLEANEKVKRAFEEQRLVPYFQPIVSAQTNEIEKYEVLARLVDNTNTVEMGPDDFIPVLKGLRLYNRFTLNLLEKAIVIAKQESIDISFNISTKDISSYRSFKRLLAIVKGSGIARRLHFELLECDSLVSIDRLSKAIMDLKRFGCRVGLDDLGKEYSNFDRLMALPIDFVKLDRGVTPSLGADGEVAMVVQKIIEFAKRKQISVVAEFCCTAELCLSAKALGIDFVQGFYLGKPSEAVCREVNKF